MLAGRRLQGATVAKRQGADSVCREKQDKNGPSSRLALRIVAVPTWYSIVTHQVFPMAPTNSSRSLHPLRYKSPVPGKRSAQSNPANYAGVREVPVWKEADAHATARALRF